MEQLVKILSKKLTTPLQLDDEQAAVVQYGLFALVQLVAIGVAITLFGMITQCLYECWIVFVAVGLLKKSTGGAHAKTSNGCFVVSVLTVSAIGWISSNLPLLPLGNILSVGLSLAAFISSCIIVFLLAPVDSPNKPITSEKKIRRLRRQSAITLGLYGILILTFGLLYLSHAWLLSLGVSLSLATLWQSLTIIKAARDKSTRRKDH